MKKTTQDHRPEPSEGDIQKAAYFLWQERGRPEGRDVETWLEAREKLRHRAAPPPRSTPKARRARAAANKL